MREILTMSAGVMVGAAVVALWAWIWALREEVKTLSVRLKRLETTVGEVSAAGQLEVVDREAAIEKLYQKVLDLVNLAIAEARK
jgi:hypothetical protein